MEQIFITCLLGPWTADNKADNLPAAHRDGAGGVPVGVVSPALVVALVPGPEVGDDEAHPAAGLVIPAAGHNNSAAPHIVMPSRAGRPSPYGISPSLHSLAVAGVQGEAAPGPLHRGRGDTRHLAHEHGLGALLHAQTLEGLHPLGRPPRDPGRRFSLTFNFQSSHLYLTDCLPEDQCILNRFFYFRSQQLFYKYQGLYYWCKLGDCNIKSRIFFELQCRMR